ncbi:MAG: efflux RND transporter periplasmic adaptor subunit [Candidatus Aminicenantes bacterium]|jgi:RND family efflux transporter MFP subunit
MNKNAIFSVPPARFVFLLLIFLIFGMSCRQQEESEVRKDPRTAVELAPVIHKKMARPVHTYGRLSSQKEVKLSFKIGGIIERIFVDEGQSVKKGQALARLNLSEIESRVKQARSGFEKAERDFERVKNLYEEKAATLEQYQNVQTALEVAKSRLDAAEFNLRFSEIRAPSQGRILKRLMEEDELAGPGIPIFFFASTDLDWIVRVGISDRDLVRIRMNDPAEVVFDAYPGTTFKGRVAEIVEAADPMTGTFEVELTVDIQSYKLASGFVAEVDILPSSKKMYAIIPVDALVEADKNAGYVYTVDHESKTAKRFPVTIGFLFGDQVAVESGLEGIEEVITVGASYLTEGSKVRVKERQP